jgi:hypothetical protein
MLCACIALAFSELGKEPTDANPGKLFDIMFQDVEPVVYVATTLPGEPLPVIESTGLNGIFYP